MRPATKAAIALFASALSLAGAEPYRKPPKAVLDALNSPLTPTLAISPTRDFAMQGSPSAIRRLLNWRSPCCASPVCASIPKPTDSTTPSSTVPCRSARFPRAPRSKWSFRPTPSSASAAGAPTPPTSLSPTPPSAASNSGSATPPARRARSKACASTPSWAAASAGGGGGRGGGAAPGPSDVQWMPDGKTLLVQMVKPNRGPAPAELRSCPPDPTSRKASAARPPWSPMRTCSRPRTTKISSSITPPRSSPSSMSPPAKPPPSARPASSNPRASRPMAKTFSSPPSTAPSPISTPRANSPRTSRSGTAPARCFTKSPACRSKIASPSTA